VVGDPPTKDPYSNSNQLIIDRVDPDVPGTCPRLQTASIPNIYVSQETSTKDPYSNSNQLIIDRVDPVKLSEPVKAPYSKNNRSICLARGFHKGSQQQSSFKYTVNDGILITGVS
jgi:hypothetical protein